MSAPAAGAAHRPLTWRRSAIPVLLAVAGWAVLGIVVFAAAGPLRAIAVFAFVLTGPGTAIVRLLPVRDLLAKAVLAVALSMSLATLAAEAEAAVIHRALSPTLILAVLAGICSAAALTELAISRR